MKTTPSPVTHLTVSQHFPVDVLDAIARAVHEASLPSPVSSLDPLAPTPHSAPLAIPSSHPASHWPSSLSRKTLSSLCLVSKAFYEASKPWLWARLQVNVPRCWLSILNEVCGEDPPDEEGNPAQIHYSQTEKAILNILGPASGVEDTGSHDHAHDPRPRSLTALLEASSSSPVQYTDPAVPSSSIPHDLLTPPASRDPSPARLRLRAASPGRWKFIQTVNKTIHSIEPGLYVPTPLDPSPGRHVRHLDFNHFRTIGMRRYVGEGVHSRFVTEARLERLIKEMPNLTAFGATEFMDSAISVGVLSELILRGPSASFALRRVSRGRGAVEEPTEEDEDEERRAECKALQALDLCGCISSVFVDALQEFVEREELGLQFHSDPDSDSESRHERERGRGRHGPAPKPQRLFPGLKRLGMRGVTSVPSSTLEAFVISFPSLTHLDLSGTRCEPSLLASLSTLSHRSHLRLTSLSLARCPRLTSEAITSFLVDGGEATAHLTQLSLYGDATYPSPITKEDMRDIVVKAPCFKSGKLEYLDISSCPIDGSFLYSSSRTGAIPPQPSLRSLGLSHIHSLPLGAVAEFLRDKAPNVEILTLVSSTPELLGTASHGGNAKATARSISIALHSKIIRDLATPPFSFSASLPSSSADEGGADAPTRLRVIELSPATLTSLGGGAGVWKIVKSRGGRAWYVDSGCAWVNGRLRRGLSSEVGQCVIGGAGWGEMESGNGGGGSSIGWHSRKMEILNEQGLLGREDGLYGAVAFAYMG